MNILYAVFYRRLFAGLAGLVACAISAASPDLTLANTYREGADIRDYYVSEKLDGVRAYWDGKTLSSRRGNVFAAPQWFLANFPKTPMDGELWTRRGDFENISGIVRRKQPHDGWRQIQYMIFDLPATQGDFDERLAKMKTIIANAGLPHLQIVQQREINDDESLHELMRDVVAAGGEGLMLRRKSAPYRGGRGDDLLKLKPFSDAEARVIAHYPGKGKFTGMLGSIEVEIENGLRFKIGSGFTDEERQKPPPIGAIITYRHSGFNKNGIPRFAVFLRVRNDEPRQ